ncbi:MAG: SDR family oxidoreductase [Pirellulales bacterium]|nr:SDR family oxidoreductase [Pirellulales bacterium]
MTIVIGASSGIGAAIARRFAASGSHVVLAARREEKLAETKCKIEESGDSASWKKVDVTNYEQVAELVDSTAREHGQIDILINCAGHAVAKPLLQTTVEELDAQLDSNLRGLCYSCHATVPHMIRQGSGHIINIGSICSMNHYPEYATYVAAKFGVLGFSRSLYEEVRHHGIRVNVLCPAAVNTAWADVAGAKLPWPQDERLQPEDLAETALFCVSLPKRVQVENIVLWPTCEPTV